MSVRRRNLLAGAIVLVLAAMVAVGVWIVVDDADELSRRRTTVAVHNRASIEVFARSSVYELSVPSFPVSPGESIEIECSFLGQYNVANADGGVVVAGACPSQGGIEVTITDELVGITGG